MVKKIKFAWVACALIYSLPLCARDPDDLVACGGHLSGPAVAQLASLVRSRDQLKTAGPSAGNDRVVATLDAVIVEKRQKLIESGLDEAAIDAEVARLNNPDAAVIAQRPADPAAVPDEDDFPAIKIAPAPLPPGPVVATPPAAAPPVAAPVAPPVQRVTVNVVPMSPGVHIQEVPAGTYPWPRRP